MKKLDNFSNCLTILRNADFKLADNNDIYRTGVIGQFNLSLRSPRYSTKLRTVCTPLRL